MWPLLLFSVVSLAIIIERAIVVSAARTPKQKLDQALDDITRNDLSAALSRYNGLISPAAKLGAYICTSKQLPRGDLENDVSRMGSRQVKLLSKHLHLLELIGKISPMVGLSGTVLGLAGTFQKVAGLKTMADPSVLASGIWEALVTTVTGLFVAIPAIIFYHLFENRIKAISFEMKNHAETVLSLIKEKK